MKNFRRAAQCRRYEEVGRLAVELGPAVVEYCCGDFRAADPRRAAASRKYSRLLLGPHHDAGRALFLSRRVAPRRNCRPLCARLRPGRQGRGHKPGWITVAHALLRAASRLISRSQLYVRLGRRDESRRGTQECVRHRRAPRDSLQWRRRSLTQRRRAAENSFTTWFALRLCASAPLRQSRLRV